MSFLSCEEMLAAARSQNISLSEAILRSDLAESRLTEAHSREMMHHLWQVMQATSRDYDPAQRSRSGLSGGDAAKVEQAHQEGKSLGGDYLAAVTAEALVYRLGKFQTSRNTGRESDIDQYRNRYFIHQCHRVIL